MYAERRRRGLLVVVTIAGLALVQIAISFRHWSTLETVHNYDTAAYYALARNIALGRGLTDNLLWLFLGAAESVVRPAGEYWPPGWPLALGLLMRVFGETQRTAMAICAALSTLLPVLVFGLAWLVFAQRPRRLGLAALAGALVLFQARVHPTNVISDVTLSYQLCVLLGLCVHALLEARSSARAHVVLGMALAAPMLLRAEGFILLLAGLLCLGWRARCCPAPEMIVRLCAMVAGAVACVAPMWIYNLYEFGAIVPTPRSLIMFVTRYEEIYYFLSDPSFATWSRQGLGEILGVRWHRVAGMARELFVQLPWPLVIAGGAGSIAAVVQRDARMYPPVAFVVLSWLMPPLIAPWGTNPDRFVLNVTPVLCVLAAAGFATLLATLRSLTARQRPAVRASVVCSAAAAIGIACTAWYWPMNFTLRGDAAWWRGLEKIPEYLSDPREIAKLELQPDDVVLAMDPWQISANLDVGSVMCPFDGPDALRAVIAKYRPRYMVVRKGTLLERYVQLAPDLAARQKARSADATWYEFVY